MRILLAGGNRFVGYELLVRLVVAGYDVAVLSIDPPAAELAQHAQWIRVDRNDGVALRRALRRASFDVIIDNIAFVPRHVRLLAESLQGGLTRYILTSTVDVYSRQFPVARCEDEAPTEPTVLEGMEGRERYIRGKRACEAELRSLGLPYTIIRPAMVSGRRDNVSMPPTHQMAPWEEMGRSLFFPTRILDGGPVLLRADDEAVFRMVWVGDVARAMLWALREERALGQAFNVSGDEVWTSERLVRAVAASAGRQPDIVWASARELEEAGMGDYQLPYGLGPYWCLADNAKIRGLGWRPTPASEWLPSLVEAPAEVSARPAWEGRLREISLARRLHCRQSAVKAAVPKPAEASNPGPPATRTPIAGGFSAAASERWREKLSPKLVPAHFRHFLGGTLSAVGIGGWKGDLDRATDAQYVEAIVRAIHQGINAVDTAINYRAMRGERCVDEALRRLCRQGMQRGAVLIATKGGYLTGDADEPGAFADQIRRDYVDSGLVSTEEASRGHSIAPGFLQNQIDRSRTNLGVEQIDLYLVHNPEIALAALGPERFEEVFGATMAVLEEAVAAGKIRSYGVSTWDGLVAAQGDRGLLSLAGLVDIARRTAGEHHHFRAVQLPFNFLRTDALFAQNQSVAGQPCSPLEAARRLGLYAFTSATLCQGEKLDGACALSGLGRLEPQTAALQVARSAPDVGTALVGMRCVAHVDQALRAAELEPLPWDGLVRELRRSARGGAS